MKKLIFTLILSLVLTSIALAENSTTTDESTTNTYTIDLGDGQGALLVFGDNNTIYMPPEPKTPEEVVNEFQADTNALVLGKTDVIAKDGTVTTFTKIVLRIESRGIKVLWTEQE